MAKLEASVIEKYQSILAKDPQSQVFAPLAEAYREMGMLKEAAQTVTAGVQRHPQFTSGLVTYAKILRDMGNLLKALEVLKKASNLSPENILAHQLTAEIHLVNKNPKEALKAFKMILFLNPSSASAQKAIQKLESITADEYEEDVFSMAKLPDIRLGTANKAEPESDYKPAPPTHDKALERMLSLIDAFIVRNDLEKAKMLLADTINEFGDTPDLEKRKRSLQMRSNESEDAVPLKPLRSRQELIHEKKVDTLRLMLRRIEEYRAQG